MTSTAKSPSRMRMYGIALCTIGFIVSFACVNLLTWTATSRIEMLTFGTAQYVLGIFLSSWGGFAGGLLFTQGAKLTLNARKHRVKPLPHGLVSGLGDFVLYLRPFSDDQSRGAVEKVYHRGFGPTAIETFFISGKTEEEQLADALQPIGELVAVGSPDSTDRIAGASRVYTAEGENWKVEVQGLIQQARFVVVGLGVSDGALWELMEVLSSLEPQQFVLLVPMTRAEYERFRVAAIQFARASQNHPTRAALRRRCLEDLLPSHSNSDNNERLPCGIKGLIYYSHDWKPHFVGLETVGQLGNVALNKLYAALEAALRPLTRRLVQYEEPTGTDSSWRIEHQENWYFEWSRLVLLYVLLGSLPGMLGFTIGWLAFGRQESFSLGTVVILSSIGIILGVTMRRQVFPWSGRVQTSRRDNAVWLLYAVLAAALTLPFSAVIRVGTPYVFIYLFLAVFAGFAVSSIERLLDYTFAGVVGVLVGLGYFVVARALFPTAVFIDGFQLVVTVFTTVGIAGVLYRRSADRLVERIGTAEAGLVSLTPYALYLGSTGTVPNSAAPSNSAMLALAIGLMCVAAFRVIFALCPLQQSSKFALLGAALAVAAGLQVTI